jgi:hypothetical protein
MRNFIINLLGGYTKCELLSLFEKLNKISKKLEYTERLLKKARKNDHRDERGRFKKAD